MILLRIINHLCLSSLISFTMAPTATTSVSSTTISSTATATCLNIAPGKNGYLPPEACDVVLYYVPSFAAAVLFCVFYGMTTLTHLIQAVVYKKVSTIFDLLKCHN
jgi:hypothetical protein